MTVGRVAVAVLAVVLATLLIGLWVLAMTWLTGRRRNLAPWDDEPVECAYCGRGLGSRMLRVGIEGPGGVSYCDDICRVQYRLRAIRESLWGGG